MQKVIDDEEFLSRRVEELEKLVEGYHKDLLKYITETMIQINELDEKDDEIAKLRKELEELEEINKSLQDKIIEPLPCPICGEKKVQLYHQHPSDVSARYFIKCRRCWTSTESWCAESRKEVIDLWNEMVKNAKANKDAQ